jgi:uncharacterized repeat protein (TIGR03803 family)
MSKQTWWKVTCGICVLSVMAAIDSPAQTFKTLTSFDGVTGTPWSLVSLVQGTDGNLFGTTSNGGAYGNGTVFRVTPAGTLTTLYSFCAIPLNCTDGMTPYGGLIQAADGNLYGTNTFAGFGGTGVVFKISPQGTETTVAALAGSGQPAGTLVQAANGTFYGTTGDQDGYFSMIFSVPVPPGPFITTLYTFCSEAPNCDTGENPSALIQATNGNLYGTTQNDGGVGGDGTIFEMTPKDSLMNLHTFGGADGSAPIGSLVQASNGGLYGTTTEGGANGYGTVFRASLKGSLTTLHSFNSSDGAYPSAGLVQATDGNFYGTTARGGANGAGTLFKMSPGGTLTTLYNFCADSNCTDGSGPYGALFQATNGKFYGVTTGGGANNDGTVFGLNVGLGPFVETVPTSGKVGRGVLILGTNLTGTSSVTFNGTPAVFTVRSKTLISATVPAGGTSGTVEVVTPGGALSSNVSFQVAP